MTNNVRVALIGLDTSHTIEFARRMQAPDCPPDQKVAGMTAVTCLRFATPFQSESGLDERQATLESWGVKVTPDFDEAVADCDAIMLEINDPAYHLEYFRKVAGLGKPVVLDKPLADTAANGRAILKLAAEHGTLATSSSSLRFAPELLRACVDVPEPGFGAVYGPLGRAPAGSSIVWYGVHAFEMLERAMGMGADTVTCVRDNRGVVAVVGYSDGRRGVVELNEGSYLYGGCLRDADKAVPFVIDGGRLYSDQLDLIGRFFQGGPAPCALDDAMEVMAMLDAAERSARSEKPEVVSK